MYDVYFYEAFEEEQNEIRRYCSATCIKAGYTRKTIQEAAHDQPPARMISLRTQSTIPLPWAHQLDAILSRSAGYDHLARYRSQAQSQLHYGYLPNYCAQAVAEQALTLWMALLRKLPRQTTQFTTFHRDGITGSECQGRTLLVVGVGNIGYHIVKIGQAMGMNVLGVDLEEKFNDLTYNTFAQALPQADIIVSAMNLTDQNENYFHYEKMKKAKPTALFINIARGELAFASDVLRLLQHQHLSGAAMDVYHCESELSVMLRDNQRDSSNPEIQAIFELMQLDQVILTPHNAFNTHEAVDRKSSQSIEQILHFQEHGDFRWSLPDPV